MFRNYFKIAFRNLSRNKGFSAINIIGLAIGMASALVILLWVQNERSIDRSYPNADRLYLLYNRDTIDHTIWAWNQTPKSIAPVLKKDYAAVEDAARYRDIRFLLTVGDKSLNSDGAYADSGFIKMFGFPLLQGDPALALAGPNNIVLTEQTAKRLFGSQDPMGRIVRINNSDEFTVSGVLKDLSANTSFHFDYLVPWLFMAHQGWNDEQNWGNNSIYTYVLLQPGVSGAAFQYPGREYYPASFQRHGKSLWRTNDPPPPVWRGKKREAGGRPTRYGPVILHYRCFHPAHCVYQLHEP